MFPYVTDGRDLNSGQSKAPWSQQDIQMLTEAELRNVFAEDKRLQEQYNNVDNYINYMNDFMDIVDANPGQFNWWDSTVPYSIDTMGFAERYGLNDEDARMGSGERIDAEQEAYNTSEERFNALMSSPELAALRDQYGLTSQYQNSDGDVFQFNGINFAEIYEVDDSEGRFIEPIMNLANSVALSLAVGEASNVFGDFLSTQAELGNLGETLQVVNQVADRFEQAGYSANQAASILNNSNVIMNIAQTIDELEEEESTPEQINNITSEAVQIIRDVDPEPDTPIEEVEPEFEAPAREPETTPVLDLPINIPPPTLPEPEEPVVQEPSEAEAAETPEELDIFEDTVADSSDSVQDLLGGYIQEIESQITQSQDETLSQVQEIVASQVANLPAGVNEQQVSEIVNQAVSSIPQADVLTEQQVQDIVTSAVDSIEGPDYGGEFANINQEIADITAEVIRANADLNQVSEETQNRLNELDLDIQDLSTVLGVDLEALRTGQLTQEQAMAELVEETGRQQEEASEERRNLQIAILNVGGDVERLDEQTQQRFEEFGESVNELFSDVDVDIEALQEGQITQTEMAEEAATERQVLQQSLLNVQGDVNQLDANTRQQFEEFGESVNELFSDVDVDIEALQEGQISQAEAQEAFEQSVSEQFGEVGEGLAGLGAGLEGLGQGVAGLGAGLGLGLLGLGQQQEQIVAELTKPEPIPFNPFLKGLSPFQPLTPISLSPVKEKDAVSELNKFIGRQSGMLV